MTKAKTHEAGWCPLLNLNRMHVACASPIYFVSNTRPYSHACIRHHGVQQTPHSWFTDISWCDFCFARGRWGVEGHGAIFLLYIWVRKVNGCRVGPRVCIPWRDGKFFTETLNPLALMFMCGPGSAVGTATGYGLDGPGIECRWGRGFPPFQTGPGAHPTSCTKGTVSLPGVKSVRGVTLTPQLLLVPWSRKSRAIPLLPL